MVPTRTLLLPLSTALLASALTLAPASAQTAQAEAAAPRAALVQLPDFTVFP